MPEQANSSRFPSLSYESNRTRTLLRNRLTRFLPFDRHAGARPHVQVTLADEDYLRLLTDMEIEIAGTVERARDTYEAGADPAGPFPKLDDLVSARWIRIVRNRIFTPVEFSRASKPALSEGGASAYAALKQNQYKRTYSFPSGLAHNSALSATIREIKNGQLTLQEIGCQRPEWVAARLWETLYSKLSDDQVTLSQWLDRCKALGYPRLVPSAAWDDSVAERFRIAALQLLNQERFMGWGEVHEFFAREMANAENVELSVAKQHLPPVPKTLVERYLWLTSPRCERPVDQGLWALEDFGGLLSVLLADVEKASLSAAPHPLFEKIFVLAEERPEILFLVTLRVAQAPVLLADMLLRPSSSALACLMVWRWKLRRDPWESILLQLDDRAAKIAAVNDAAAVARFLLDNKAAPESEIAHLWAAAYIEKPTLDKDAEDNREMRQYLLEELRQLQAECCKGVLKALFESLNGGPGTPAFDAAISFIDASSAGKLVDPTPLVRAYCDAIARRDNSLSAHQISVQQATALFDLAMRANADLQDGFLNPFEASKHLNVLPNANAAMAAMTAARSIRVHIRVLCRAVAGQSGRSPDRLIAALVSSIRIGSLARLEKGQVDAFSAQYEAGFLQNEPDRPISADLADALDNLDAQQREDLLKAILDIEEPMVLGQLLSLMPSDDRNTLEGRLLELTPATSSELYTLPALQARIAQLLNAELPDVAARFIEDEQRVRTLGTIPGRTLLRLQHQLELLLLRRDWGSIERFAIPEGMPEQERDTAKELIEFHKALVALKKPEGDRAAAEQMFATLHRKRPQVAAYTVNVHAATVAKMLGEDIFGFVDNEAVSDALSEIAESEQAILTSPPLTKDDITRIRLNNVLLLLAIRRPKQALDSLAELDTERPREVKEGSPMKRGLKSTHSAWVIMPNFC